MKSLFADRTEQKQPGKLPDPQQEIERCRELTGALRNQCIADARGNGREGSSRR